MSKRKGKYQILSFREYATEQRILAGDGFAFIDAGWNTAGGKLGEELVAKHVCILRVRKWMFKDALVFLYGEAAEELIDEAKEAGVYQFGDPGKNHHDAKVRSQWASSKSGYYWFDLATTGTTSDSTIVFNYTNATAA